MSDSVGPLDSWYFIRCDDEKMVLDVRTADPWLVEIRWDEIERVCLIPGDFLMTDEVYVFVRGRANSYVVPLDAHGGAELMGAMPASVCPYELRIAFATGDPGQQFWWPPIEEQEG